MRTFNITTSTYLCKILFLFCFNGQLFAQSYFWEPTVGPYGGPVYGIAVNQENLDVLVASYQGVYRSSDKGANWTLLGLSHEAVNAVAVNGNGSIFASSGDGVFRSTDNGETWQKVLTGSGHSTPQSLVIDNAGQIYYASFFSSVYRSSDNGDTWSPIGLSNTRALTVTSDNQILAATSNGMRRFNGIYWASVGLSGKDLNSVAVNNSGHIFAIEVYHDLYHSSDNGATWNPIDLGPVDIRYLAANPAGHIFAGCFGNGGVFRTTDNGESWVNISPPAAGNIHAFAFGNDSTVFCAASDGMYYSPDNGNNWQYSSNGLKNIYFTALTAKDNGKLFVGGYEVGVIRSDNGGDNWQSLGLNSVNSDINSIAINSSGHIFAGGTRLGIYRSTDNGENWVRLYDSLSITPALVSELMISDDNLIFAATTQDFGPAPCGFFRSADNGETWVMSNTGIQEEWPSGFCLAQNGIGDIFMGIQNGVYRSSDNGDNWTSAGLEGYLIGSLAVNSDNHIFAGSWWSGKIFRSTDNGASWDTLYSSSSNAIADLVVNEKGYLYAATTNGIIHSTDNGDTWNTLNSGMPDSLSCVKLALDANGFLYTCTYSNGMYRSVETTTGILDSRPACFNVGVYPNPCRSTVMLTLTASEKTDAELQIGDVNGVKIKLAETCQLSPGQNHITVDISDWPTGLYQCRIITTGGETGICKMVVIH